MTVSGNVTAPTITLGATGGTLTQTGGTIAASGTLTLTSSGLASQSGGGHQCGYFDGDHRVAVVDPGGERGFRRSAARPAVPSA